MLHAIVDGDVIIARNHYRTFASLASSNSLAIDGCDGSFVHMTSIFLDEADKQMSQRSTGNPPSAGAQAIVYILASTIPYVAPALQKHGSEHSLATLSRLLSMCQAITSSWNSPFNVSGSHAVFHATIEGTTSPNVFALHGENIGNSTPCQTYASGAVCWDSLWETCKVGEAILTALASGSRFQPPACLVFPWTMQALDGDFAAPRTPTDAEAETKALESKSIAILGSDTFLCVPEEGLLRLASGLASPEFNLRCGPEVDYCMPSGLELKGCESSGYGAWMSLRMNTLSSDYGENAVCAISNLTFVELVYIRDYYRTVIRFFEPYIRDDGTRVGSFELMSKHLLCIQRMFSDSMHLEYVLVETLLLMVIQVPSLNANLVQRLVLDLCRHAAPAVPQALAVGKCL